VLKRDGVRRGHFALDDIRRPALIVAGVAFLAVVFLIASQMPVLTKSSPSPSAFAVAAARQHSTVLPADRFIDSVVQRDGSLGWHQLCPSLQRTLPESELQQQAQRQAALEQSSGIKLTSEFVGNRARTGGGELRYYLLTAHLPDGSTLQRTLVVSTGPSGCVENVQGVDG